MRHRLSLTPLCLLALVACGRNTVATINDEPVDRAEVLRTVQTLARNVDPILLAETTRQRTLKEEALQHVIDARLLQTAIAKAGIQVTDEALATYMGNPTEGDGAVSFAATLQQQGLDLADWQQRQRMRLLTDYYIERVIAPTVTIDDAAVKTYYREHSRDFAEAEAVHVRQIVTDQEAVAKQVYAQILKGGNFAQLAMEYSISPEAEVGGDLGWVERGQFPTVIEEQCARLSVGAVSEIVQSEYGFHIFKVLARRPGRARPFAEVRAEIAERLQQEAVAAAFAAHVATLRAEARIEIHPEALARLAVK
ncbi:MAG: peptidyl-prolyl cis-trans isomerase [Deltaproteobacteria bacterium]|nr:peptidyl-prolyl cis-trans isomerase [Deltaproteobacteria bacterium]